MSKTFSKHLGSTLPHIQDSIDTLIHGLLRSAGEGGGNKMMSKIQDAGDAYYETYSYIKEGQKTS